MALNRKFVEGEKVLCIYGSLIYDAICRNTSFVDDQYLYFVHYHGWKHTWDEWLPENRILKYNETNLQRQKTLKQAHLAQLSITKNSSAKKRKMKLDKSVNLGEKKVMASTSKAADNECNLKSSVNETSDEEEPMESAPEAQGPEVPTSANSSSDQSEETQEYHDDLTPETLCITIPFKISTPASFIQWFLIVMENLANPSKVIFLQNEEVIALGMERYVNILRSVYPQIPELDCIRNGAETKIQMTLNGEILYDRHELHFIKVLEECDVITVLDMNEEMQLFLTCIKVYGENHQVLYDLFNGNRLSYNQYFV